MSEEIEVLSEKVLKQINKKYGIVATRAIKMSKDLRAKLHWDETEKHQTNCLVKGCHMGRTYGYMTCELHRNIETKIRGTTDSAVQGEHVVLVEES